MAHGLVEVGTHESMESVPSARMHGRWAIVRWAAYPAVMASAFGAYAVAVASGIKVPASGYLSAALGVLLICMLEAHLPYRRAWRPDRRALKTDLIYLFGVQTVLPIILALAVGSTLAGHVRQSGDVVSGLWPRHWPIPVQFLLMLAVADCLKYWLHAAAHRYEPLWRLHAVHHAPDQLHALNVSRFHPVERTLQYLL